MTEEQRLNIQYLIPDILPLDHISLSAKRIRFIRGQGIILYNDDYAVELYMPKSPQETPVFFGVQRHFGKIQELGEYFRKIPVQHYNDPATTDQMRRQFDEAIFQYLPYPDIDSQWVIPGIGSNLSVKETAEIYLKNELSGAA